MKQTMYSNKIDTFESHNAAAWDAESEIGDVAEVSTSANRIVVRSPVAQRVPLRPNPAIRGDNGGRGVRGRGRGNDSGNGRDGSHRGRGVTRGNLSGNSSRSGQNSVSAGRGNGRLAESASRGGHFRDGSGSNAVPSVNSRGQHEIPRRRADRVRESGTNSSTGWAEPPRLLTDARKFHIQNEVHLRKNTKRFLKKPVDGERFSAIGFYQWPMEEDDPEELFRAQLKDLDNLKTSWQVFIDWNQSRHWLRIRASLPSGETAVAEVIKGIRQAVQSAHARAIMAAPIYIVVPPRHSTDSTLLVAHIDGQKHVCGLKFSKSSSDEELKKQTPSRSLKMEATIEKFRTDLTKTLNELSHLKDSMRMRVHFGELHLTHWQTDLTDGKQSFDSFMKMMKRTRTRGVFEKRVDPQTVLYMMKKVKSNPDKFLVWSATDYQLSLVKPKHVVIFVVQNSSGEMFQIEADIDKADGGYQCGTVKVIEDERRNKCMEIVTIDIEQVDWNIEIISETAGTMTDSSFQDLVESCIQPFVRTGLKSQALEEREDMYGEKYPRIAPRSQPGLRVDKVTLQSIYRFKTRAGGYCLELTINRDWEGLSTVPEPEVSAEVSMFHDQWDTEMESNEHTTADRNWKKDTSNFFPNGGFKVFMEQLGYLLEGFQVSKSVSTI